MSLNNGVTLASVWVTSVGSSSAQRSLKKDITDADNIYGEAGRFIDQNEILKRFHLGNTFGSLSANSVFAPGYEDPTRLMFKVEFGEWGASLLDVETIKNQLVTSKFSNVYYEDYDLFPMGLMNLDFLEFNASTNWSGLTAYNTYNYLMNTNEDARASMIKLFVLGMYAILKDMPYLFTKISGIDKLQTLDAGKGVRLKDAKITLDCIEGIDLKIRTLLLLYRKAAYDDVWQRWVLPDIYRYFKMIIYVFDRRILLTGKGTYSLEQNDFPIYALECGPCEIDIESTFENEYSTDYLELKESSTKITISVKNVKTYFANQLFNKIDSLNTKVNWIGDFDSVTERGTYNSTDISKYMNFRLRWMKRMFMIPSDYFCYYDNMTHKVGDDYDYEKLYGSNAIFGPELPEDTWHYAIVTDPIYEILSWKDLKKYLKKTMYTRSVLIRDSRYSSDRTMFENDLAKPYENSYIYEQDMILTGPDVEWALEMMRNRIEEMIHHMLHHFYLIGNEAWYNLVDPGMVDTSIPLQVLTPLLLNSSIPDMVMQEPIMNLDKPDMEYISPIMNLDIPDMEMQEPNMNLDKADMEYISPIMNLDIPDMEMQEPIMNLDIPDMNYVSPIMNLDIPDMNYVSPIMNLDIPDMNYVYPNLDTSIPDMTYVKPILDTSIPDMVMVEPIFDESKSDMVMVEPIFDESKSDMEYVVPIMNLDIPDMTMVEPILDTSKDKMTMVEPIFDESKSDMEYVVPIMDTSKPDMNLISDIVDASHVDMTYVEPIMNIDKIDMTYVEPVMNLEKADMTMVKPIIDTTVNHGPMVEPIFDESKSDMVMVEPENISKDNKLNLLNPSFAFDESKPNMTMVEPIFDTSKALMNMLSDIINDDKVSMNMLNNIVDTSKSLMTMVSPLLYSDTEKHNLIPITLTDLHLLHSLYVIPEFNNSKVTGLMNPLDINTFKTDMKMTSPILNTSIVDMDMVSPLMNTSIADMKMITPEFNLEIPDMKMTSPILNTSIADMKMVSPVMNTSIADMVMLKPIFNDKLNDMVMTSPILNTSIADMKMVEPIMNTSIADMVMLKPIFNDKLNDMIMTSPIDSSKLSNMEMVSPDLSSKLNSMSMVSPELNTKLGNMEMVSPIINDDKIHEPMVTPEFNSKTNMVPLTSPEYKDKLLSMKMVSPIMDTSISSFDMISNKDNSEYSVNMKMIELTDSPKLVQKIEALTKIDTDELKNIGTLEMLSLADIIEETYKELLERSKNMKLLDNKPNIPPHVHMKMQSIKQPPRNTFIVELLHKVDQAAIDRAWDAKRYAESDKSAGTKGTAL